jgi:nucleoside-triphosphatase
MLALLSGQIGVGKTTICQRVLALARTRGYRCGGLLTPAILDRRGYKVGIAALDLLSGQSWTLARIDQPMDGPQIGRYHFGARALQRGLTAIAQAAQECDLVLIDEVGPLELEHRKGLAPALDILPHTPLALVVVRSALLDRLLAHLDGVEVAVFIATEENRETLPHRIVACLFGDTKP